MSRRSFLVVPAAAALLVACGGGGSSAQPTTAATPAAPSAATATAPAARRAAAPRVSTIATGLRCPWSIAFLPGGDAIVSERDSGRIVRIPAGGGRPRTVMTIPGVAHADGGENGLLGLAVSPRYDVDRLVYAYYSTARDNRIARFRLGQPRTIRPILTGLRVGVIHDGGRIAFGPDRRLYAGVGETGQGGLAQDMRSRNGKILRMDADGRDVQIFSSGHRNVQGLAWDRAGRLWATEFGQNTYDEVNLVHRGDNGGWPVVEGPGTDGGRYAAPKVTWRPTSTASPSGAAIVGSTLYIGTLQGRALFRVALDGSRARKLSPILKGYGRIRAVTRAPDGSLWVGTSNTDGRGSPRGGDDRILKVEV